MANEIKYQINVEIADNTVTKDNPNDKIFVVVSTGSADKERIVQEMHKLNPGLEIETLRLVQDLQNRVMINLIMAGMSVNNGLVVASPGCKGLVHGSAWDPNYNKIYVNFQQGKEIREAISKALINVRGKKVDSVMISSSLDAATNREEFAATAGSNFTLYGKNIKIAGEDPSVGIVLVDEDGTETPISGGLIGVNQPSKLVFFIPADMADGVYTLRLTTQYAGSQMLKTPRVMEQTIYIGEVTEPDTPVTGGEDDEEDGPEVQ